MGDHKPDPKPDPKLGKKLACYICEGCGLGERLDIEGLKRSAEQAEGVQTVKSHDFLCSPAGVQLIQHDIDKDGVTHVCVAACSRRTKTEAFDFENVAVARANLREGVIWARPEGHEYQQATQQMAADTLRLGLCEAKLMNVPYNSQQPFSQQPLSQQGRIDHILIVGGGITGMTAALEAAKAGYRSSIVEQGAELGGAMGKMKARIPDRAPYADPRDTSIAAMKADIEISDKINVHLNSTLNKTSGAPGRFVANIINEAGVTTTESFGAIVQATGFKAYDANKLTEFDYSDNADVITQMELEALALAAGEGTIKRTSDGKDITNVLFIQCAGQRSDKTGHLSYCSGFCCSASIKQAMYFKDQNLDIDTTVLYTDLRMLGSQGEEFYRSAQKKGVIFSVGVADSIRQGSNGPVVSFQDWILDEPVEVEFDLVVLATGMEANSGGNGGRVVDSNDHDVEAEIGAEIGAEVTDADKEPVSRVSIPVESILNLDYQQGPDVPQWWAGFTDLNCAGLPYETQRTGIYTAGPVRRPMDAKQAIEDGTAAAMKAIHALEDAAESRAAAPRSGDLSYPKFEQQGCTQCKRCIVECPYSAIDEDAQGWPSFNESRCRRCGICLGACPVQVISFDDTSIDSVGQQIQNLDRPGKPQEKPRILVLACENAAYPALDMAAAEGNVWSEWARVIPIRCLGAVNNLWITDALRNVNDGVNDGVNDEGADRGYDGVVLMGCRKDDGLDCHFVKGGEIVNSRMNALSNTLQQLDIDQHRVTRHEVSINDIQRAPQLINDMAETIQRLGMNPLNSSSESEHSPMQTSSNDKNG